VEDSPLIRHPLQLLAAVGTCNALELHVTTLCYCSSVNTRNHVMQCIR